MISIPVLIVLQNDTELTSYKNRMLLPIVKEYVSHHAIFNNAVIICANEIDELYANVLGFVNIYKYEESVLSDKNTFKAVNKYFLEVNKDADWCMVLKPYRIMTDYSQFIKGIQNISNKYDLILFKTSAYEQSSIELDGNNKLSLSTMGNSKSVKSIINDALQIAKVDFLNKCFANSNGDVDKYSQLLLQGKIKFLESNDILISFTTVEQIDNFIRFLTDIKYKSTII